MTKPIYKEGTQIMAEKVKTNSPTGTTTLRLRDKKSGIFLKHTKKGCRMSLQDMMDSVAKKITEPLNSSGETHLENIVDSMIHLSQNYSDKSASAAVKAASFVTQLAYGQNPKAETDRKEDSQRVKIVIVTHPDIMDKTLYKEDAPRKPLVPTWVEAEFQDGFSKPSEALIKVPPQRTYPSMTKESVNTQWIFDENTAEINKLTTGRPVSVVKAEAASDTTPLRISKIGKILSGAIHLADALCVNAETVLVEVIPD